MSNDLPSKSGHQTLRGDLCCTTVNPDDCHGRLIYQSTKEKGENIVEQKF